MIHPEPAPATRITARRLTAKSLFKLIFISGLIPSCLFFAGIGLSAAAGAQTLQLNGHYLTGPTALIAALLLWLPCLGLFSALLWLFAAPGLFLWSLFKPIHLEFKGI